MKLHISLILLHISASVVLSSDEQTCSKDDTSCSEASTSTSVVDEALYNAYKFKSFTTREDFVISEELDHIDSIKSEDPDSALKQVKRLLAKHPDSPRALHSLVRIYRILYNNLSEENKSIGQIEYLTKMVQLILKIVKMDSEKVPFELLSTVVDFGLANTIAMGEREMSIEILHQIVFGPRKEEFDEEDKEYYFQSLLDQKFFSGDLDEVKQLIIQRTEQGIIPSMSVRMLMAILTRIEEKKSDEPYKRYNEEMINQTIPEGQEERDELILYTLDLEKELRRAGKMEELLIMLDLLVELKIYPSRYQRSVTHMRGLTAQPIWTLKETEYQDKLEELENNWETLRDEAWQLIKETPAQNITAGEKSLDLQSKWRQYIYHGHGNPSFPDWMCVHTPVTCKLLKDYPWATKCPLGTIKISVIEPGAHIQPHVGGANFKLRAHLPLVVPKPNATETLNMARMRVADKHEVVWEEGKMVVFDDSFEHEVWNLTSGPRVILIIDLVHPDMTQEQFTEVEHMFKFVQGDTGKVAVPVMASAEKA